MFREGWHTTKQSLVLFLCQICIYDQLKLSRGQAQCKKNHSPQTLQAQLHCRITAKISDVFCHHLTCHVFESNNIFSWEQRHFLLFASRTHGKVWDFLYFALPQTPDQNFFLLQFMCGKIRILHQIEFNKVILTKLLRIMHHLEWISSAILITCQRGKEFTNSFLGVAFDIHNYYCHSISTGARPAVLISDWSREPVFIYCHTKTGYQIHVVLLIQILWKWLSEKQNALKTIFVKTCIKSYDSYRKCSEKFSEKSKIVRKRWKNVFDLPRIFRKFYSFILSVVYDKIFINQVCFRTEKF